jgi:hypothetical protein
VSIARGNNTMERNQQRLLRSISSISSNSREREISRDI